MWGSLVIGRRRYYIGIIGYKEEVLCGDHWV